MEDLYLPEEILKIVSGKNYYKDDIGMSDSSVLIFDDMVLKIRNDSQSVENEKLMMRWLENKISVPELIFDCSERGMNYLLMSRVTGKMSCDDEFMNDPVFLISVLADSMKNLWNVNIYDCPVVNDLNSVLAEAKFRVEHGLVDVDDAEPETFGKSGFKDPEELLFWLHDNKPDEDFVLSHGDFCLPNVFIDEGRFSGFVDIGRMGASDRYKDIALCCRSLRHNFAGVYGGRTYEGYDEKRFFDALGIDPDFDKIRYYILLDELF